MNANALSSPAPAVPWHRQRWPWLLMLGPAVVVVAGLFTAWLAVHSDDGVVAADYYRRGLLINRDIAKTTRGAAIGAVATFAGDGEVRVSISGVAAASAAPAALTLRLVHPTRAGLDHSVALGASADGTYAGSMPAIAAGRWLVTVESDTWRLPTIEVTAPFPELRLGAAASR